MPDERLPHRTLRTTFWLTAFFTLLFGLRGEASMAFGLAIGSAIGLSSLWSLLFVVPRLVRPGARSAQLLLGLVAFAKLPLYALVLTFAMKSPHVNQLAVFLGAAAVPVVLVLKVLGWQLIQRVNSTGEEACPSSSSASS